MAETVIVRTAGGTFMAMDVPDEGHARERFDAAVEKGDLTVVDPATVELVTDADGTSRYVATELDLEPPAKGKGKG